MAIDEIIGVGLDLRLGIQRNYSKGIIIVLNEKMGGFLKTTGHVEKEPLKLDEPFGEKGQKTNSQDCQETKKKQFGCFDSYGGEGSNSAFTFHFSIDNVGKIGHYTIF